MAAGIDEDIKLAGMKHLHLAHVFAVAGALVDTQLKDALGLGCRGGRRCQLRPAFKGREQGDLYALVGRRGCGCVPKRSSHPEKFVVLAQAEIQLGKRLDGGTRNQGVEHRRLRPDLLPEGTHRTHAQTRQRRNERVGKVAFSQLELRAVLQAVAA